MRQASKSILQLKYTLKRCVQPLTVLSPSPTVKSLTSHLVIRSSDQNEMIMSRFHRMFASFSDPKPYKDLTLGVLKEAAAGGEKRVALTPASVALLLKQGFKGINIESDAGTLSSFTDKAYQSSGAKISDRLSVLSSSDVILKVRPPSIIEASSLKPGSLLVSYLAPAKNKDLIDELAKKEITALGLDCIPRTISRAQMFDTVSDPSHTSPMIDLITSHLSSHQWPTWLGTVQWWRRQVDSSDSFVDRSLQLAGFPPPRSL